MRNRNSPSGLEPFYFGEPNTQLFGCYHAPQAEMSRDCSMVLCYPMGAEYVRFHRAFRQLASRLAAVGFPVLRFDFYGCGDSTGHSEEGQLGRWCTNISSAIGEIHRRCGSVKVCLVGLRLGGTLATMVSAARGDVDSLVLWDPVVNGKAYLEELYALHRPLLRYAHMQPQAATRDKQLLEILGFPLSDTLLTELADIDLYAIRQPPAPHLLVIESHAVMPQGPFKEHLQCLGTNVKYQYLPEPQLWIWVNGISNVRLSPGILQAVLSWVMEVYP